jgi:DeoR/GlpR family transcriptional regulator of sugar metabolism
MLKKERQAHIIRQLNVHNRVLSADLSQQLHVSEDTIRRDLHELAEEGQVIKVHGGALSPSYNHATPRQSVYAFEEKDAIARKALGLIREGMCVLTGGGTTVRALARLLPDDLAVTFFTISPQVALELIEHPAAEVILLGGPISRQNQICSGGEVVSRLHDLRVDLCLLGTTGIDAVVGLTESDWEVVQVKRAMMRAAQQTAILTIGEKLGSTHRMKLCPLTDVDWLITDLPLEATALRPYAQPGVSLV